MSNRVALLIVTSALVLPVAAQDAEVKVKKVSAPYTSPASGADMYKAYCASCHGVKGLAMVQWRST